MALHVVKRVEALGPDVVLAPERYDPRRDALRCDGAVPLGDLATCVRETVSPARASGRFLVLDTSDAQEGRVVIRKPAVSDLGSTKKRIRAGDVIVSRLRPYLRQVAFVDDALPGLEDDVTLVGSTEFYVLRAVDERSIAFLVPFLLSDPVQRVLAAAQEGGHHPRIKASVVLGLPVPPAFLVRRQRIARDVHEAIRLHRTAEQVLARHARDAGTP